MPVQDRGPHRTKILLAGLFKDQLCLRGRVVCARGTRPCAHAARRSDSLQLPICPCSGRLLSPFYPLRRFSFRRKTLRPRLRSTLVSGF